MVQAAIRMQMSCAVSDVILLGTRMCLESFATVLKKLGYVLHLHRMIAIPVFESPISKLVHPQDKLLTTCWHDADVQCKQKQLWLD